MSDNEFPAIIAIAHRDSGLTAAEFDYQLTLGSEVGRGAYQGLGNALYTIGQRHGLTDAEMAEQYREQINDTITTAKGRSYTGWSDASRGPIRYAR